MSKWIVGDTKRLSLPFATTFPSPPPPPSPIRRDPKIPLLCIVYHHLTSPPIHHHVHYTVPRTICQRQIPLTLDQSVHAPPPSMHFSGSVHSTRSASSTLKSVGATTGGGGVVGGGAAADDRSLDGGGGGDDDSAGANSAGGGVSALGRRRQLDAVRSRVSSAALFILEHYAETTGRKLADVLEVCFGVGEVAEARGRGSGVTMCVADRVERRRQHVYPQSVSRLFTNGGYLYALLHLQIDDSFGRMNDPSCLGCLRAVRLIRISGGSRRSPGGRWRLVCGRRAHGGRRGRAGRPRAC